jgi:elongation factor Ts
MIRMSTISAAAVDQLRKRTGIQMMKCKAALIEANGDMEKAVEILRKQNKDAQDKFVSREVAEGRIAVFIDPTKKVGAILEMRCETAPTAKNDLFVRLANDLARQVALQAAGGPEDLLKAPYIDEAKKSVNDRIGEVVGLIRENMKVSRFARLSGLLGSYIHHDGSVGVLVQVEGDKADPQLLRDVSMHIVAKNPLALRREDVAADVIAREKEIAQSQIAADPKNANKPANILEKISEGKLKSWYAENVLLEQPFVKDDSKTIGDLLKSAGLTLVQYQRYKVGEIAQPA